MTSLWPLIITILKEIFYLNKFQNFTSMVNTTAVNGLINANTSIKSEQQIGNFSSLLKDESCELKHLTVDNGPNVN